MAALSGVVRIASSVAVVLVLVAGVCPTYVRAQSQDAAGRQIEILRGQISHARAAGAAPEEIGKLWLGMARQYENRIQATEAEDAFAHAIELLRGTTDVADYADALHGMAAMYVWEGRLAGAKECLEKALEAYQRLGDRRHASQVQVAIALQLLAEHNFRQAADRASLGIDGLRAGKDVDPSELMAAYLTRSRALCWMGDCQHALQDVARAREVVAGRLPPNSMDLMAISATEGMDEIHMGRVDEGERAMQEALRLATARTEVTQDMHWQLQLGILREFAAVLKDAHRKNEARQVAAEAAEVEANSPHGCKGCTVGAAALAFVP